MKEGIAMSFILTLPPKGKLLEILETPPLRGQLEQLDSPNLFPIDISRVKESCFILLKNCLKFQISLTQSVFRSLDAISYPSCYL